MPESVNAELLAVAKRALLAIQKSHAQTFLRDDLAAAIMRAERAESFPAVDPAQHERMRAALRNVVSALPPEICDRAMWPIVEQCRAALGEAPHLKIWLHTKTCHRCAATEHSDANGDTFEVALRTIGWATIKDGHAWVCPQCVREHPALGEAPEKT